MAFRPMLALCSVTLSLALVGSAGCDLHDQSSDLRSIDASDLDERFACADVTIVAANVDGSEAIFVGVEDALAAAVADLGDPVEAIYSLPDERITIRRALGSNVYQGLCGRDNGEMWRVDDRQDAVAGEVIVQLVPLADGTVRVTTELIDLVLEAPDHGPQYELAPTRIESLDLDGE